MGKSLKGRELGVGIHQEKSGLYTARYVNRFGKRVTKRFKKLQECRKWIAEETYKNEHSKLSAGADILMDEWFNEWISYKEKIVKPGTTIVYRNRYNLNIKDEVGNIPLSEIKYKNYENILSNMIESGYAKATINHVRYVFTDLINYAIEQDVIAVSPLKKTSLKDLGKQKKKSVALTLDEQRIFLKAAKNTKYFDEFHFILLTGLRVSELRGLQWENVDFKNKKIHIERITQRLKGKWVFGTPKTTSGERIIPLTDEALKILKARKKKNKKLKNIPEEFKQTVFLNKNGKPTDNNTFNAVINEICKENHIPKITMHSLRHTFATRCIESGMTPKTLQIILGHSNVTITMNLYVHVNEETKEREMANMEKYFSI